MKRQWDIEDLIEHFTLVSDELESLANKSGATRLGFAVLLKCFQYEGRFLIESRAERAIVKTFVEDLRRVDGKPRLLYQLAQAALDHPDQTVRAGIYLVVNEAQLRAIVREYQAGPPITSRCRCACRHPIGITTAG